MNQPVVNAKPKTDPEAQRVRGALLAQGYTIARFAREHGFKYATVQAVLHRRRGLRRDGKSAKIQAALRRFAA